MKNYKKIIAGAVAVVISAGATTSIAFAAKDKDTDSSAETTAASEPASAANDEGASDREALDKPAYKDETVYVLCTQNSGIKNVVVSDWLRNAPALSQISDVSDLSDIENVKGDEGFTVKGEKVSWDANGKDIYYKGTTKKELPVSVEMQYYLDGQKVHPEDIIGRNGHLKIRWNYTNNAKRTITVNGSQREVYIPFACVSTALLNSDKFLNATISSGKIISDGSRLIVVGMGFPGLNESLDLDSIESFNAELPEYVEFEADVVGFEMNTSATVVTNEIFSNLDFDGDLNFGELKEQMQKLVDASNQLCDGTAELYNGISQLNTKTGDVSDGIDKLAAGSLSLKKGADELSSGASELSEGAKTLSDSTTALRKGIKSAKDGSGKFTSGIDKLAAGTTTLKGGIDSAKTGSAQLSSGLKQADKGTDTLVAGANTLSSGADKVSSGAKELADGLSTAGSSLTNTITANEQALSALQTAYKNNPTTELSHAISTLQTTIAAQKQIAASMNAGGTLSNGAVAIQSGSAELSTGSKTLYSGISSLDSNLSKLAEGAGSLDAGLKTLTTGAVDLNKGFTSLQSGAETLDAGLGELLTGSTQLEAGVLKLYQSTGALADGAGTLAEGVNTLSDGASELKVGFQAFADGIAKLEAGAKELNDGSQQFHDEGITKLSSAIDEKLPSILDNFKAIREISKEYNNFSGISDNMEGSVKFIYIFDGTD